MDLYPGQDERDCGEQMTGELAEARSGPRILDLRAGCAADIGREAGCFVVIPADDGDLFARHAGPVEFTGSGCGAGGIGKNGNDERVGHRGEF
jgi:hypothetical protein